ncbi:hypothetical protein, conserved [Trypanosoma brucei gambiense DAL972]|uniref:Uncharacterized protein n=1 Tax=Trypanosoma brucei gambiense (strain MHOM/CI/86/DAL972) TaxID=679716 RepID=C9ZK73_TRYB9|nr:hypothetical protein, conserved [Trypanosoma brucei gambiense DAL972]CBH09837.1 hypothetical protein, conserved [Trypanosoma brucei gambiense DAL972]|eukprot:XP_011772130.1 hypothetical protein, conserved [Trypanosoma brucei gambiense DAL972]
MGPLVVVSPEVEEARKRASVYFAPCVGIKATPAKLPSGRGTPTVIVCDPVSEVDGTCVVVVRLQREFQGAVEPKNSVSGFMVVAEWVAVFPPSYPAAPCSWRYAKDGCVQGSEHDSGGGANRCCGLQSFVLEEAISKLTAPKLSHSGGCNDTVENAADYYGKLRYGCSRLSSLRSVDASGSSTEVSMDAGAVGRGVEQATGSFFLSGFSFLCTWWGALELDESCLVLERDCVHSGSTTALYEESNGWSLRDDFVGYFEDFMGSNMVLRPKRQFAAAFMPNGGILSWGRSDRSEAKRIDDRSASASLAKGRLHPDATSSGDFSSSSPLFNRRCGNAGCGDGIDGNTIGLTGVAGVLSHGPDSQSVQGRIFLTNSALDLSVVPKGVSKERRMLLPSLLAPENILHTKKYTMNDVCLYDDKPHSALCKNAHITRNAKALRGVSLTFRTLSHIVKGALVAQTPLLCARKLLIPALAQSVEAMQAQRQPFWAGVVVCCVVLPSILSEEPAFPDIAKHLIHPVECYRCVSVVSHVFFTMDQSVKFREVELVMSAIEDAYCNAALNQQLHMASRSSPINAYGDSGSGGPGTVGAKDKYLSPALLPADTCAICGLSLLPGGQGHGSGGAEGGATPPPSSKRNGCLILRCIYCGHGGHMSHIMAWWNDQSVHRCPRGCNCVCVY